MKLKRGKYVFWWFFKIDLCSATAMESSRRDLFNNVAEHRSMLKTDQSTCYPRFSFTPKTRIELPKTGVSFLLEWPNILFWCKSNIKYRYLSLHRQIRSWSYSDHVLAVFWSETGRQFTSELNKLWSILIPRGVLFNVVISTCAAFPCQGPTFDAPRLTCKHIFKRAILQNRPRVIESTQKLLPVQKRSMEEVGVCVLRPSIHKADPNNLQTR